MTQPGASVCPLVADAMLLSTHLSEVDFRLHRIILLVMMLLNITYNSIRYVVSNKTIFTCLKQCQILQPCCCYCMSCLSVSRLTLGCHLWGLETRSGSLLGEDPPTGELGLGSRGFRGKSPCKLGPWPFSVVSNHITPFQLLRIDTKIPHIIKISGINWAVTPNNIRSVIMDFNERFRNQLKSGSFAKQFFNLEQLLFTANLH